MVGERPPECFPELLPVQVQLPCDRPGPQKLPHFRATGWGLDATLGPATRSRTSEQESERKPELARGRPRQDSQGTSPPQASSGKNESFSCVEPAC